jgi:hypothetical protein
MEISDQYDGERGYKMLHANTEVFDGKSIDWAMDLKGIL